MLFMIFAVVELILARRAGWLAPSGMLMRAEQQLILFLGPLPLVFYQWNLIRHEGQTIGKRIMKLRIVRTDGAPVDFLRGVVLRDWILHVPMAAVYVFAGPVSFVPMLVSGAVYGPVLLAARRGLHDYVADTKVVDAR
jgi:uncharacterized RDD family membrane protein YckC